MVSALTATKEWSKSKLQKRQKKVENIYLGFLWMHYCLSLWKKKIDFNNDILNRRSLKTFISIHLFAHCEAYWFSKYNYFIDTSTYCLFIPSYNYFFTFKVGCNEQWTLCQLTLINISPDLKKMAFLSGHLSAGTIRMVGKHLDRYCNCWIHCACAWIHELFFNWS